ncbi:MAG TPA: ABC transporter permease subunit [Candidatus Brocadiia bacterium]|nr:ABC transporter permease subunit [Candidatus Brocadiia bacterium]
MKISDMLRRGLRRWVTVRDCPSRTGAAAASMLCILLTLCVWHVLTAGPVQDRTIDPLTLPSLKETVNSFHSLWFERAVARGAFWSLGRVLAGFLLGAGIGVPLGVTAASFRRLYAFMNPLSIFGRNVPIAALIPLTLIWFGIGETQKVMFIFLATVAFIFFDAANAVDGVSEAYLDSAYTLGARFVPRHGALWALAAGIAYAAAFGAAYCILVSRPAEAELASAWNGNLGLAVGTGLVLGFVLWFPIVAFQVVRKALFALALPDIVNSLRLLFGIAFGYIMLAEVINADYGLGSIIITSQRRGPREHIYLSLILIALLAFAIDRGILVAQRRLFPYRASGGR